MGETIANIIGGFLVLLVLGAIIGGGVLVSWMQAETEARIYNQKFSTSYIAKDFFVAGDEIKKLHDKDIPQRAQENVINAKVKIEK